MQYFGTNTIWYVLFGIITIVELMYVLVESDNWKMMLALFLTFSGIVFMIEIQVLAIFKGYDYYPKIFDKVSQIDDGIIGNIFSQFSIAATALLVSFLKLKQYWYAICSLLYGCIEELFLYLGIYKHNWYRTWMTVIGFFVLLWLMNKIYKKAFNNPGPIFKYFLIFFAVYVPFIHFFNWPERVIGYPQYNEEILPDKFHSIILQSLITLFILFNVTMITHFKRLRWQWHAIIITLLYIAYYAAYAFNYIIYTDIRVLTIYATAQIFGMHLCVYVVCKLYGYVDENNYYKQTLV